jgi:hypothetical protein
MSMMSPTRGAEPVNDLRHDLKKYGKRRFLGQPGGHLIQLQTPADMPLPAIWLLLTRVLVLLTTLAPAALADPVLAEPAAITALRAELVRFTLAGDRPPRPGPFKLRAPQDYRAIGPVTAPGKSGSIAVDLELAEEIPRMFGRPSGVRANNHKPWARANPRVVI